MQNPFVYGEVVPGESFVDREIRARPADRRPRRWTEGLPHLAAPVRQVLAHPAGAERPGAARHAHGRGHRQQLQLVLVLPRGIRAGARSGRDALGARARLAHEGDQLDASRGAIRHRRGWPWRFSVSFPLVKNDRDVNRLANEVFALPGRLAAEQKRSVVVALDEFQAIDAFNGGSVEHALRAAAQQQRQVGYVFAGSEPSLMEKMIGPKRPFYKAGPVMRLQKIPADIFAEFIEARFGKSGIRAEAGTRRGDRRPRRQPSLRRAAARARNLGRCARVGREESDARLTAHDAGQAARRAGDALRGGLAASHAGTARGVSRRRSSERPGPPLGGRARAAIAWAVRRAFRHRSPLFSNRISS